MKIYACFDFLQIFSTITGEDKVNCASDSEEEAEDEHSRLKNDIKVAWTKHHAIRMHHQFIVQLDHCR